MTILISHIAFKPPSVTEHTHIQCLSLNALRMVVRCVPYATIFNNRTSRAMVITVLSVHVQQGWNRLSGDVGYIPGLHSIIPYGSNNRNDIFILRGSMNISLLL